MTLGQLISQYIAEHDLSLRTFAARCGVSHGYIAILIRGVNPTTGEPLRPTLDKLKAIASGMGITVDELLRSVDEFDVDISDGSPTVTADVVTFPITGEVAAHYGHAGEADAIQDTVDVPVQYLRGRPASDYFVLRVVGDSMYPDYKSGDVVLVQKTPTLSRSGQIGVVQNGGDATLKKVEYVMGEDWLRLVPLNRDYPEQLVTGPELEEWRVRGIPRLVIREIDD